MSKKSVLLVSNCCQFLVSSNIIMITSVVAVQLWASPVWKTLPFLLMPLPKVLETLVKNWAAILGPRGIRVNAVALGVIDTDMSRIYEDRSGTQVTLGMQALKRVLKPGYCRRSCFWRPMGHAGSQGASIPVDGGTKL